MDSGELQFDLLCSFLEECPAEFSGASVFTKIDCSDNPEQHYTSDTTFDSCGQMLVSKVRTQKMGISLFRLVTLSVSCWISIPILWDLTRQFLAC